jgi:hypothetical protein
VARGSLSDRYDELTGRRDELMGATAAQVHPVHVQAVKVLGDLLSMGQQFSTGKVNPGLRAMMRMLHKMEPELVTELSVVPPEVIKEFLADLARRILTVVDVNDGTVSTPVSSDQSPS